MDHELHLIVDMLAFAIDHHSPATVILIAGDRDYAYAMSTLRLRQYNVILIAPTSSNVSQSLKSQASLVIDWNYAILRKRPEADTLPVWQPCRDIDGDTVERLVREIRDADEDPSVALISSSHCTSTTVTHVRHVSAELLQPSVSQRNTDSTDAAQPAPTFTLKKAASIFPETPGVGSVKSRARSATVRSSHTDSCGDIQPAPTCTAQTSGRCTVGSATPCTISTTQSTQAVLDIVRDSVSLLTESDAPSAHTYAVNAVELHLNEGQAFVDDIVTPPTNNTSPPIAKTSGTLVSPESSLAPSAPDVDIIMPNIKMGLREATSVHSSEYNALPVESVKVKIRRLTPPQFLPLIDHLLLARSEGNMRPERSTIAVALCRDDKDVYKRAGVNKFKKYILLAEQASLIESGGDGWVALHPSLFEEETSAPVLPTPLIVHSNKPSASQDDIEASTSPTTTIPPPSVAPQSTILNTNAQTPPTEPDKPIPLDSYPLISSSHSTSTRTTHTRHVSAELSVSQRNTDSTDAAQPAPTCKAQKAASIFPETPGVGSVTPWAISTTQPTQAVPDIDRGSVSPLTENNAPSVHTYAMNAVEPHLNEGQAIVDDIVTPPTNNASPPIAKTSGTLVSRESSAPSVPDFDVNMPNAEAGSPQAIPVHNSSEYHALPVESVEMKIRRLTPPHLLPLINQLLLARSKGNMRPGRSMIAVALCKDDKNVYKIAGVKKFKHYVLLAERASLIELGQSGSDRWIALHPKLFEEETSAPESPTPLTVQSDDTSPGSPALLTVHNDDASESPAPSTVHSDDSAPDSPAPLTTHSDDSAPDSPAPLTTHSDDSAPDSPAPLTVHSDDSAPESPAPLTVHSDDSAPESPAPLTAHSDDSAPESPIPLTVHSNNPSALQNDIEASTSPTATILPPSAVPQSTIPTTNIQSLPAVSDDTPIPLYLQPLRFWKMLRRVG
jgi:hypothetical protein